MSWKTVRTLSSYAIVASLSVCAATFAERRRSLPAAEVLDAADLLTIQPGTAEVVHGLLDGLDRVAGAPASIRWRSALVRCRVQGAVAGPQVASASCSRAFELSGGLPREAREEAAVERSLNLLRLGDARGAELILPRPEQVENDHLRAKVGWALGRARLGQPGRAWDAVPALRDAEGALAAAVRRNPDLEEWRAIAKLRLGEGFRAVGEDGYADRNLDEALAQERELDRKNPDWATYRLYLIRILRARGRAGDLKEAAALGEALRAREPGRWEFGAGL